MKKVLKNNIGLVLAIVLIAIVIGLIWSAISSLAPPDKEKTEKYFKRDNKDIVLITEFFINSDYSEISISKNFEKEGFMFTGVNTRDREMGDEAVVKAVNRLFKKGYKSIFKSGNTISFEKWAMFEKDRGLAYSINGEDEPVVEFLIKLEPLSKDGWYYYEADYEKYRNR